jgi:hypothetical protein
MQQPCSISDIRHHSAHSVARCIMRSMSVAHFDSPLVHSADFADYPAAAPALLGATDIIDSVDVLLDPQDRTSHPVPTSNPQSALDAASSAFAGMYSTCCSEASGYRSAPTPRPAAAASVFPRQAAAATQRGPVSPRQLLRIREIHNEQPCVVASSTCRRRSHPRPQPLQTWSARYGPAAAAAAVVLCLSCVAYIAAAQQAPCSSAWSTAALSVARSALAATSLPNQGLAIVAGGLGLQFSFCD